MKKKKLLTFLLPLVLVACGGALKNLIDPKLSDAEVVSTLQTTNINYSYYANANSAGGTNRWDTTTIQVYIPTPDPQSPDYATQNDLAQKARNAINTINTKLAGLMTLSEVQVQPSGSGYFQVSYLTSYVPQGSTDYASYCANVSTGAGVGNVVLPASDGRFDATLPWINLGNGHCDVTQDIVTHEFGHALGLGAHFQGFGDGSSISSAFWDVLATLYGNPVRTVANALTVRRAAD